MMITARIAPGLLILLLQGCGPDIPVTDLQGDGGAGGPDLAAPVDLGPPLQPGDPGPAEVTFAVRSDRGVHAISSLIYGSSGARDIATNRQALVRSGGNRLTAYNWETNASNAGNDYCFQNDAYLGTTDTPGDAVHPLLTTARDHGAAALLTVPVVDYVAGDKKGGSGPPGCSGDVRKSGANYLDTRMKKNRAQKGAPFAATPDPTDAYVNQDEFVSWVKGAVPGARVLYALDNEPDLWASTHAEVHPQAVGYDELCQRNIDYAKAIKAVAPDAKITGFVSYGWQGYVNLQNAPDQGKKGEFIDYYLGRMSAAETAAGKRLIDYLDLHWYPEARGDNIRITAPGTSAGLVEARVQAPRSLWDESYTESSWITGSINGPIRLLPRLLDKIAKNYPGTQLAFTEWNYGGGGHISGAIAAADVLGIFGREGVGAASIWELSADESYLYAGLTAYRNFDGAGGAFGDTSIEATNSDRVKASVYASLDAGSPARVILLAINKTTGPLRAGITVAHPTSFGHARVYTLTSAGARLFPAATIAAVAQNAFNYAMPAQSISVLVPGP